MNNNLLQQIEKYKIVPVVKVERAGDTGRLCEALSTGGLPVAEITFRTPAAREAISAAVKEFPQMIVGAGTIVNVEQAKMAVDAGAQFLVSPGISHKVIEYALNQNIMIFPGACTPTEVMRIMEYGLSVAKFFPAQQYGGLSTIKALSAPFSDIRFMPTGGISAANVKEYLAFPKIAACGGSWMVRPELIAEGRYDEIRRLTEEAVGLVGE
ncbi:bifunctional 4-hydroxy-2-oxoglutarate aldolase/2-dehydro-3-deoxy-phosphogluconate aldolase [Lactonifactor sp. BIOML-A3]|uniref:bifunctional 4-hydroxy-2-oxoglutarate aldolase/2-dehydro-3-deoxy-phosphogluconate aldolase n=1 Tax=unclassified Lactonifactor TaxID=2636670 RepID=UPI0012AF3E27|nr:MULTISPECIES: bifunctional 4-hydroxy-2-oxoglutarate aldolase/2-dehydro-3-deoxy-phosphogluconate aldolase [unclassified Lactonifactor]MSA00778.1 bifunctional 4-hydroxy-2-oxoglutarate aldolase/2-dehydro-3-deoxy-phosphogluconate aldolase [Lactonifactor sp. BIOML-A5]MSA06976.1 bifunctional 4-hydroxy-2-oxoglutarate aldolase/2-dehydro-3-deoxy-phosphogluconate aldolase [Lactonifactor sp. BIOML-A4]MSA11615.1 bifunctional 4-hydroxy-2-oxoglutarate aldolase/2-dehydro-3-deoxy-phosphogluconate aldolase [L